MRRSGPARRKLQQIFEPESGTTLIRSSVKKIENATNRSQKNNCIPKRRIAFKLLAFFKASVSK
jgi:hypothetical protein